LLILHTEIMDILRVKKAHLPPASAARKRKVTSAANIDEPADPEPGDAGPSGTQEGASDGQDRDADGSTDDSDA
jgi:Myb-like DNA-binding protein REB1